MVASRILRRRSRCAAEPRSSSASEFVVVKVSILFRYRAEATNASGHNRNTFQLQIDAVNRERRGVPLRIALLSYRSKPHCGGQGVYVRHLSRELTALGHEVEVFSGDRKSTRLNSSHVEISYAVFCLKKKTRATTPASCARSCIRARTR